MKNLAQHITIILLSILLLTSCGGGGSSSGSSSSASSTTRIFPSTPPDSIEFLYAVDNDYDFDYLINDANSGIYIPIKVTSSICGVPGFGNNTNAVTVSGGNTNLDVNDYIEITAEYQLGGTGDFFSTTTTTLSGLYNTNNEAAVPSNDWNYNTKGSYEDDDGIFLMAYDIHSDVTAGYQDGTVLRFKLDGASIPGDVACNIADNNTHSIVIQNNGFVLIPDAEVEFTAATSSTTISALQANDKVRISFNVTGNRCGTLGYGSSPRDSNGYTFASYDYIEVDVAYTVSGTSNLDTVELTGIYLPGDTRDGDDSNVLNGNGEYDSSGVFSMIYTVPNDAINNWTSGDTMTFSFSSSYFYDYVGRIDCSLNNNDDHVLTIN